MKSKKMNYAKKMKHVDKVVLVIYAISIVLIIGILVHHHLKDSPYFYVEPKLQLYGIAIGNTTYPKIELSNIPVNPDYNAIIFSNENDFEVSFELQIVNSTDELGTQYVIVSSYSCEIVNGTEWLTVRCDKEGKGK